jgi:hypothetical protein
MIIILDKLNKLKIKMLLELKMKKYYEKFD